MNADRAVEEAVRDLLRSRSPLARRLAELPDDLPLGPGGLGLDSIALVELLLDCEERFGIGGMGGRGGSAGLLAGPPLTVDRLVAHVRAAVGS
jgi:acyl carrier protein